VARSSTQVRENGGPFGQGFFDLSLRNGVSLSWIRVCRQRLIYALCPPLRKKIRPKKATAATGVRQCDSFGNFADCHRVYREEELGIA